MRYGYLVAMWSALVLTAPAGEAAATIWEQKDIFNAVFLADGKTLCTRLMGGKVVAWDVTTLRRKPDLDGINNSCKRSPGYSERRWMIDIHRVDEAQRRVVIWDLVNGRKASTHEFEKEWVFDVIPSPDGRLLAGGVIELGDTPVGLWDRKTGKRLHTLANKMLPTVSYLLAWSLDSKTLVVGGGDGTIKIWDTATGKLLHSLKGHTGDVKALAFSPDGKTLLSAGGVDGVPGSICLWNPATGEQRARWRKGHECQINYVAFSADGNTLVSTSETDRRAVIWDWPAGTVRREIIAPDGIRDMSVSADGKLLALTVYDEGLTLWDLDTGRRRLSPEHDKERQRLEELPRQQRERQAIARAARKVGHVERLRHAEYALQIQQAERAIKDWNFDQARAMLDGLKPRDGAADLRGFEWHYLYAQLPREQVLADAWALPDSVRAAVSRDGTTVALVREDGNIGLHDLLAKKERAVLKVEDGRIDELAFSPDGIVLATLEQKRGKEERTLRLWNARTARLLGELASAKGIQSALAFSTDGRWLASAAASGEVNLWDVHGRKSIRTMTVPGKKVFSLTFSCDGQLLAAGCEGVCQLWETATGKARPALSHGERAVVFEVLQQNKPPELNRVKVQNPVISAAFSPDDKWIVTQDSTEARLWEIEGGRLARSFLHDGNQTLRFGLDSDTLFSNFRLLDARKGKHIAGYSPNAEQRTAIDEEGETTRARELSSAQSILAVTADRKHIRFRELFLQAPSRVLSDLRVNFPGLAFSDDGNELIACGDKGLVRWHVQSGKLSAGSQKVGEEDTVDLLLEAKSPGVRCNDLTVSLREFATMGAVAYLGGKPNALTVIGLSPDGRLLATTRDGKVTLRDAANGKPICTLPTFAEEEDPLSFHVQFSRDGKTLLTWKDDVVSWDTATGKERNRILPPDQVVGLRLGPDGTTPQALVVQKKKTATPRLWDPATGETIAELHGHTASIVRAVFSHDGRRLATGGLDGEVRLWDAHTGHPLLMLKGHPDFVRSIVFHPNGKVIAVAGTTAEITVWSARDPGTRP